MPKRRFPKRSLAGASLLEAWSDVFIYGYAFFDDFEDKTGVRLNGRHAPSLPESEAAWHAYGRQFLAAHGKLTNDGDPVWALQQFGEPRLA